MNGRGAPRDIRPEGIEPAAWEAFVADLRQVAVPPESDLAAEHQRVAAAAASGVPVAAPAGASSPIPRWRRRTVFAGLFSTIVGKILAGTVAIAAAPAGLGAVGGLPDPVQGFVDDHVFQRAVQERQQVRLEDPGVAESIDAIQERIRQQLRLENHATEPGEGTGTQSQNQNQHQQGAGECLEGDCGEGTQSQSQTQQGEGTQSQSQTQQGEGTQSQPQSGGGDGSGRDRSGS